jgi:SAM-dependent methyltransferase
MTACSACGSAMSPLLETRDYNRGVSQETFRYLRCPGCALVSLADVPGDLGRYYATGYHTLPASQVEVERGAEHERYKIDLVLRYATGGRLLEIGPSWGAFCLLAKGAGFEVEAIEMDPACCEFLSSTLGVRVIRSADEAAALSGATTPDVIALWHVLEHLRDPWAMLAGAAERLAPGGVLVVATPSPAAFQFGLFGRFWTHVDAPRHLHLLPSDLLRRRMNELGFETLLCTTTDPGSIGWNEFGWRFSLANLVSPPVLKRALRFGGRLVAWLFAPIERREGGGSAYTAVFRKRTAGR